MKQTLTLFSRSLKKNYDYWLKKNWYYHSFLTSFYTFTIPPHQRVLHIHCKSGALLNAVKPSFGLGIDEDAECIRHAQDRYTHLSFQQKSYKQLPHNSSFDYIILSSATMEVDDIQELFESLHPLCHARTRLIIDSYSFLWEPILWITQKFGLRRKTVLKNWITMSDLGNFLRLANFEPVTQGRQLLIPCYIPLISWIVNGFIAPLPFINRLCLNEWLIARPQLEKKAALDFTVSVVIPCKNERGNIEAAVRRCPEMGKAMELIFIEGNSSDGTYEEMMRVQSAYPEKKILCLKQDKKGKGEAVRKAFAHATGDILMILDADLTAPPEEMPKFVTALAQGHGDFINGSRLIYGMEDEAMRTLNLIANHGFALGFSWLLGQPIKDTLCGTKVLFKKDYELIAANRHYFGDFDPYGDFDLLFGAAKLNLKIIDMPVHYKQRTYGTSQISRFQGGFLLVCMSWVAFKKFKLQHS